MAIFLVSLVVMLLVVAAMAIGVMNGRAPISGSCGGVGPGGKCGLCSGDVSACKNKLKNKLNQQ